MSKSSKRFGLVHKYGSDKALIGYLSLWYLSNLVLVQYCYGTVQFWSDMVLCLSFNYLSNKNVYIIFPIFGISIDQLLKLAAWPTSIALSTLSKCNSRRSCFINLLHYNLLLLYGQFKVKFTRK